MANNKNSSTSDQNNDMVLESAKLTRTPQMSLFEILDPRPRADSGPYSNTIEFYDSLPKYSWEAQREFKDLKNAILTRRCVLRGIEFTAIIKPAIIRKPDGSTVLIYPGPREELLEDALRKLAVSGNGAIIEGRAGVTFTLYQLQQELASTGHSYNLNEIKEAIQVCRGATLECQQIDGESYISSSFFPMVGLTTRGDFLKKGGNARCYVQFSPMVDSSIQSLTFRQFNYRLSMGIKSPLARFLFKRMSHYYVQASEKNPYTPSLVSFLSQSPRVPSPRMPENIRAMKNALDILVEHEVIERYEANPAKKGRKTLDVYYVIYPHPTFIKDAIIANKKAKLIKLRAVENSVIDHDIFEDFNVEALPDTFE